MTVLIKVNTESRLMQRMYMYAKIYSDLYLSTPDGPYVYRLQGIYCKQYKNKMPRDKISPDKISLGINSPIYFVQWDFVWGTLS